MNSQQGTLDSFFYDLARFGATRDSGGHPLSTENSHRPPEGSSSSSLAEYEVGWGTADLLLTFLYFFLSFLTHLFMGVAMEDRRILGMLFLFFFY